MSPLRWDVLALSFVLALPLVGLWLRGEFSFEELITRLPWCLAAAWAVVALLRWAATPQQPPAEKKPADAPAEDEAPAQAA
jgi:hypothetical protein